MSHTTSHQPGLDMLDFKLIRPTG